jgi:hypothetical protein
VLDPAGDVRDRLNHPYPKPWNPKPNTRILIYPYTERLGLDPTLEPRDYEDVPWAEEDEDMASVSVGVESRRSAVGCRGEVSQSPRFSASLIGLRSLGFVGALWARRTLVPVPWLAPFLLWRCVRGGPLLYTADAPDQGADWTGFPIRRSGDHFPNILPLDLHILSFT